jgi:hypothetical protein
VRQVCGFECRDFGFDTRIVTALLATYKSGLDGTLKSRNALYDGPENVVSLDLMHTLFRFYAWHTKGYLIIFLFSF